MAFRDQVEMKKDDAKSVTADKAWVERWASGKIGFHQAEHNRHLIDHWPVRKPSREAAVLVPLCGKSRDMNWLHEIGYRVVGVEFVEMACEAFFEEQNHTYKRVDHGHFIRFDGEGDASGISILCADLFTLTPKDIGPVNAWYDRAATVALPPSLWSRYAEWISSVLSSGCEGLMMTFEYPKTERNGPPFSVCLADVEQHFGETFQVEMVDRIDLTSGNRWELSRVHKPVIRLTRR